MPPLRKPRWRLDVDTLRELVLLRDRGALTSLIASAAVDGPGVLGGGETGCETGERTVRPRVRSDSAGGVDSDALAA